jgi:hypothetical protein
MTDSLIIGYGGFGCACAMDFAESRGAPVLLIDTHPPSEEKGNVYADFIEIGEDEGLDSGRICNAMEGYRCILFVSSLGGESFGKAYRVIADCAGTAGAMMVTLCTVPYMFESERRERAMANLDSLYSGVSNMFVIDSQTTIDGNLSPMECLERTRATVVDSLTVLSHILESKPFKSLCPDPVYTLAFGESVVPGDAVTDALAHMFFTQSRTSGKMIVCSEKLPDDIEWERVCSILSSYSGVLPEHTEYPGHGPNGCVILCPISCRPHE